MSERFKIFFRNSIYLVIGVFIGSIGASIARTIYYVNSGIEPEMSPYMFIVFSPILSILMTITAFVFESFFTGLNFGIANRVGSFFVGLSYGLIFLLLINSWLLFFVLIFNPITIRFYSRYRRTNRPNGVPIKGKTE